MDTPNKVVQRCVECDCEDGDCNWIAVGPLDEVQYVKNWLTSLTPEERLEVFSDYCSGCGAPTPPICHCMNDD